MRRVFISSLLLLSFIVGYSADAHRSGCHRWHSCPSDSGSYVCGDTGYCSACPNNYYCKNGAYNPGWQSEENSAKSKVNNSGSTASGISSKSKYFIGKPRNKSDLMNCYIVGNNKSKIYHLRGSSYIKSMDFKEKICFSTEAEAILNGFRKAKAE